MIVKPRGGWSIRFSSPAFWLSVFAVLSMWLGITLWGLAHRIARARQLLSHVRVPAGSAGELHAVADNLFGVSIGVLRAGAGLIVGGVVALIIAASSDWAPKPLRIAIVVGTVLTLALLSFLQGIS